MTGGSRAFWEGRYRDAAASPGGLWGAEPNGWVAEQVEALALLPGHAVDLGAGEGRNAFWLAARGWRVTAVDFAAPAVEQMRRVASERDLTVDAVTADVTTWQSSEPVDLVVLCYLQLEPDVLAAAIARGAGALAPGGVLLGIWHDRDDVARGLGGTMAPTIRTTPHETAAAARAAGLTVQHSGRRDRPVAGGLACDALLVGVARPR